MGIERLACQVSDTLGVGTIAMGDQCQGLTVATGAALYRAGKSRDRERSGGRRRSPEVTGLAIGEVERNCEADGLREIDADLAIPDSNQCVQPLRSITVPHREQVRCSRLEWKRSNSGGSWVSISVSSMNSS